MWRMRYLQAVAHKDIKYELIEIGGEIYDVVYTRITQNIGHKLLNGKLQTATA